MLGHVGQERGLDRVATPPIEGALALVEESLTRVAILALQTGLGLLFAVAGIGTAVLIGQGGSPILVVQGVASALASVVLIARVDIATRLLCPRGAVWIVVVLFCALGAIEHRLQLSLSNVLIALACISAVVGSTSSVLLTVLIAWGGYTLDIMAEGGALRAENGSLLSQAVGELVILVISAGLTAVAIRILRATLAGAPARLARARSGDREPPEPRRLAAAVRSQPLLALLGRGDPAAILACLSTRERAVLEFLAQGLTPKQVAGRSFLALATVRSRIASAKRKTGARTLDQLVGLYVEATHDR